jgi:tetratricopeptide (TPR) repeat protein
VEVSATPPEEEASGTTPDAEPTDPAPDPPEPEPERSRLEFSTDPGEATVVIENQETGTRRSKETPATFEVPPGLYSWSVKKEGYASKESRRAINLETQREYTQRIDLVSVSGGGAYLARADRAYQQNKYRQAISLYQQVPEPSAEQDPTDFLRAQGRLGRIHWKQEGNYEAAIQAYRNVIEYDEARYGAYLNLAQIHFETENYGEVLENLDRVSQLKYSIPAQNQKRLRISLRARYLRGRALFQQAKDERTRNRRSKALRANQEFQGFLSSVPPDLQSTFSRQIREAQQKKEQVRTLLREELR